MPTNTNYCYIDAVGPDTPAAAKALLWLSLQEGNIGYIAVMSKGGFERSAAFIDVIGERAMKGLIKNNGIEMDGKQIKLLYRPHNMRFQSKAPVLVVYPNKKLLKIVEDNNPQNMCVLQWAEGEMHEWAESHNATRL